jgi:metal iron transporter
MAVALSVGRGGINTLLVISQVTLSMVLPFITFPLLLLVSSKEVMKVKKEQPMELVEPSPAGSLSVLARSDMLTITESAEPSLDNVSVDVEGAEQSVDFSIGKGATCVGFVIWLIIVVANSYVIVALALGQGT